MQGKGIRDYFAGIFASCETKEWINETALTDEAARAIESQDTHFVGVYGATSLKAEIAAREPVIANAAQFRAVRKLLRELGGAVAIRDELIFSGFVHSGTSELTLTQKPLNVFAMVASGKMKQPRTNEDQTALGSFSGKFMICSNRHDADIHWDSDDPRWIKTASMASRHKFLTTKDLHWQWFNPLVFGMVPAEDGGVDPRTALAEAEQMKAAALHYARNSPGWSDNVGLFVHAFGHNNMNSLFIHILDMSELGPGFAAHGFKNLPFDEVIKVLKEEAVNNVQLEPIRASGAVVRRPSTVAKGAFFFPGTDGATSLKAEITGRLPVIKDAASFRGARRMLMEELGGPNALREELLRMGFIDSSNELLTTGTTPFNVFARIASGAMKQPGMEAEQAYLGDFQDFFVIACNRPENDEHWDSEDPEWVSKASMSKRHRFLIMKDMHWQWFNALGFGLVPQSRGGVGLGPAITMVEKMKEAALTYTSKAPGWSGHTGLFFHVFGHNTVNSMHLHIIDLDSVGPAFWHFEFKNCPLDVVLKVMQEENVQLLSPGALGLLEDAKEIVRRSLTAEGLAQKGSPPKDTTASAEILTVNVGGELLTIDRSNMLLSAKGSLLHEIFEVGSSRLSIMDESHRPFLNYPHSAFKTIADHLRLMHLTPENHYLKPLRCQWEQREQVEDLAWLLGVEDLVLSEHPGRGPANLKLNPRPSGWCCRRRPAVKSIDEKV
mmetsp:Transcript_12789/g.22637  ORF Transcript_12789/g.22637 Transcript_12789/m.22637 type:complete len:722 (-) Transcript_12789:17-2182(-)